jgi:hypothetical protein
MNSNIFDGATFGIELEMDTCRRDADLGNLGTWCRKEGSIMTGAMHVGNDPKGEYNCIGGEAQVSYTNTEGELFNRVKEIFKLTQVTEYHVPSTYHSHIKLPELLKDKNLDVLKHIVNYTQNWYPRLAPIVSDLPRIEVFKEHSSNYTLPQHTMFVRAYRDKYRSRHSIMSEAQIQKIMPQTTLEEFIRKMAPMNGKTGEPCWAIFNRPGVNFAKMRSEGQTIEFRMFSGTVDDEELKNIIEFPRKFIECALNNEDPIPVFSSLRYPGYYNWLREPVGVSNMWIATDANKNKRKDIISHIRDSILEGVISRESLGNPTYWHDKL